MMLIIGLGNPGQKYQKTRHNVGFMAVDEFAEKNNFPDFKFSKKNNTFVSEDIVSKEKIILAKPQTFMNESGKTVGKLIKNLKLKIKNLIVIHDDIDLPLGKIRIVKERGSAGHKGVQSIIQNIKTDDFIRIRIGVCPETGKPKVPERFVLKKFSKNEEPILKEVLKTAIGAIETIIKEGLEKTMNEYNK